MYTGDLIELRKYFGSYSTGPYTSPYYSGSEIGTKFSHHSESEFRIIIFENGEVYQLNSDHEIQGVELHTMTELKIRFISFTGESLENIPVEKTNPNPNILFADEF